jgi:hypothetical protein
MAKVKFIIQMGKYRVYDFPCTIKILPSTLYLTVNQIEDEALDFIKNVSINNTAIVFTNSPYVLNTFMLADKAMSLIIDSLSNTDIDIERYVQGGLLDCVKTLLALGIYSIDVQALQDGVEIPKEYDVISDDNILNNHLKSFNDRFTDLLKLEVLINKEITK